MSTSTLPTAPQAAPVSPEVDYIESTIDQTSAQLRSNEAGLALLRIISGSLIWLLILVVIDHWVIDLTPWGRAGGLLLWLVGAAYGIVVYLMPPLARRIHPAYAAMAIERSAPTLKQSLLNFVWFRHAGDSAAIRPGILDALGRQAAVRLQQTEHTDVIHRGPLIRAGLLLAALIIAFGAYKIFSPKDPFQTIARVAAPFSSIQRPSRVNFESIEPGTAEVYLGQQVKLSARVTGLREGEQVVAIFNSSDQQMVDLPLTMSYSSETGDYRAEFPPPGESDLPGIRQDVTYFVRAGDAQSPTFTLRVVPAPLMEVEKIEIVHPAYTRLPPRTINSGADVAAIEGSVVTVHTRTNMPIQSANLGMNQDETEGKAPAVSLPMDIADQKATRSFTLEFLPGDGGPRYRSFQPRFVNTKGEPNPAPVTYRVETQRDLPPEIEILRPAPGKVQLPRGSKLPIEYRAVDPDFGVQRVVWNASTAARSLAEREVLFEDPQAATPQVSKTFTFDSSAYALQTGDVVTLWLAAEDGKAIGPKPEPNRKESAKLTIEITEPAPQFPEDNPQQQKPQDPNQKQQPNQKQPSDAQQKPGEKEEHKPGEQSAGREREKEQGKESGQDQKDEKASDPKEKDSSKQESGESKTDKPQEKEQGKQGDQKAQGEKGEGAPESGDSKQQQGDQKEQGRGEDQKQPSEGEQQGAGEQGGQQQKGEQQSGQQKQGEQSSGAGASGEKQQGNESGAQGAQQGADQNQGRGKQQGGQQQSTGQSQANGTESGQTSGGQNQPSNDSRGQQGRGAQETSERGGNPQGGDPGESGGKGAEQGGDDAQPKATHDGEAFERILKHQEKKAAEQGKAAQGNEAQGEGEKSEGEKSSSQDAAGNKQQGKGEQEGESGKPGEQGAQGERNDAGRNDGPGKEGQNKEGQPNNESARSDGQGSNETGSDEKQRSEGSGDQRQPGEAGKTGQGREPREGSEKGEGGQEGDPRNAREPNQERGGDRTGQGREGEQKAPTGGDAQGAQGEGEKQGKGGDQASGNKQGRGGEQGQEEKEGQGEKQGQSGKQDQGEQQSHQGGKEGQGEKSSQGGDQGQDGKQAQGEKQGSGEKGAQEGEGGKQGEGAEKGEGGKDSAGGQPGSEGQGGAAGEKGNPASNESQKGQPSSGAKGGGDAPGGKPTGGPQTGNGVPPPGTDDGTSEPNADKANEEYAKKATSLVLNYLKGQQENPDPSLLKELGWTEEELRQFAQRWADLEKRAQTDPNAKKEFDEAVKSLGLRAPGTRKRAEKSTKDNVRELQDGAPRSEPPPQYREQFRRYRRGSAN